jgi:hypothetical protein
MRLVSKFQGRDASHVLHSSFGDVVFDHDRRRLVVVIDEVQCICRPSAVTVSIISVHRDPQTHKVSLV